MLIKTQKCIKTSTIKKCIFFALASSMGEKMRGKNSDKNRRTRPTSVLKGKPSIHIKIFSSQTRPTTVQLALSTDQIRLDQDSFFLWKTSWLILCFCPMLAKKCMYNIKTKTNIYGHEFGIIPLRFLLYIFCLQQYRMLYQTFYFSKLYQTINI